MKTYLFAAAAALALAGCSDDTEPLRDCGCDGQPSDGDMIDTTSAIDAATDAPGPDAPPSSVHVVDCPTDTAQLASDVTMPGFAYVMTQTTIPTGGIVRFTTNGIHNATSGTVTGGIPAPDGVFRVPFSVTQCLQFTASGTFPFYCEFHFFTGTLTVVDPV